MSTKKPYQVKNIVTNCGHECKNTLDKKLNCRLNCDTFFFKIILLSHAEIQEDEKGKPSFVYIVLVVKSSFSGEGEITLIFLGLDFS